MRDTEILDWSLQEDVNKAFESFQSEGSTRDNEPEVDKFRSTKTKIGERSGGCVDQAWQLCE